jgi:hypothetical protein
MKKLHNILWVKNYVKLFLAQKKGKSFHVVWRNAEFEFKYNNSVRF